MLRSGDFTKPTYPEVWDRWRITAPLAVRVATSSPRRSGPPQSDPNVRHSHARPCRPPGTLPLPLELNHRGPRTFREKRGTVRIGELSSGLESELQAVSSPPRGSRVQSSQRPSSWRASLPPQSEHTRCPPVRAMSELGQPGLPMSAHMRPSHQSESRAQRTRAAMTGACGDFGWWKHREQEQPRRTPVSRCHARQSRRRGSLRWHGFGSPSVTMVSIFTTTARGSLQQRPADRREDGRSAARRRRCSSAPAG